MPHYKLLTVPIEQLHTGQNVRSDLGNLQALAASYSDGQPDSPPVVSPNGDGYQVLWGSRRVEAARLTGTEAMDVLVREPMEDDQRVLTQLVENINREPLPPLDQARAFAALVAGGWKQRDIAAAIGKSEPFVSIRLKMLTGLSGRAQQALTRGQISASVAEEMMRLPAAAQDRVLPQVRQKPVTQAKAIIDQAVVSSPRQSTTPPENDESARLLEDGADPLHVLSLAELRRARQLIETVYAENRFSDTDQHIRILICQEAATIVQVAQAILKSAGGKHG